MANDKPTPTFERGVLTISTSPPQPPPPPPLSPPFLAPASTGGVEAGASSEALRWAEGFTDPTGDLTGGDAGGCADVATVSDLMPEDDLREGRGVAKSPVTLCNLYDSCR
jgi:hypothetical protein